MSDLYAIAIGSSVELFCRAYFGGPEYIRVRAATPSLVVHYKKAHFSPVWDRVASAQIQN